eukprot:XP_003730717.1 PREDICTED: uncharacterized protein LOC100891968 [Strongylocentrotus purpuratus]
MSAKALSKVLQDDGLICQLTESIDPVDYYLPLFRDLGFQAAVSNIIGWTEQDYQDIVLQCLSMWINANGKRAGTKLVEILKGVEMPVVATYLEQELKRRPNFLIEDTSLGTLASKLDCTLVYRKLGLLLLENNCMKFDKLISFFNVLVAQREKALFHVLIKWRNQVGSSITFLEELKKILLKHGLEDAARQLHLMEYGPNAASSSAGSNPPEEHKRKLSSSSPTPSTSFAKVNSSRSSTDQVQGPSEEVTRSRNLGEEGRRSINLSKEGRRSRRSTDEVKSAKATDVDPKRSKLAKKSPDVPALVPARNGGHVLMGAGSVKKEVEERERTGVKLSSTKPTTIPRPRPLGIHQGKKLQSASNSANRGPMDIPTCSKTEEMETVNPSRSTPLHVTQKEFYDIYLLSSSKKTTYFRKMEKLIQRNGWKMTSPFDGKLGVPILKSIEKDVSNCSHVVYLITKEDRENENVDITMTIEMALKSVTGKDLGGRVIPVFCCDMSFVPLKLRTLTGVNIRDKALEERLRKSIDLNIRKEREEEYSSVSGCLR